MIITSAGSHTLCNATTRTFSFPWNSPNFDNPMLAILQRPSLPFKTLSRCRSTTIKEMYNTYVTGVVLSIALQLTLSGSYTQLCHYTYIYIYIYIHSVQLTTNAHNGQHKSSTKIQTVYTAKIQIDCMKTVATKWL